jgi:hypothetical protein
VKTQNDTLKCFKIVDEKLHWNDQALEVRPDEKFVDVCGVFSFLFYENSSLLLPGTNRPKRFSRRWSSWLSRCRKIHYSLSTGEWVGFKRQKVILCVMIIILYYLIQCNITNEYKIGFQMVKKYFTT